jgi:hypothetical protein
MKSKNLCLLFVFFFIFITTSHIFAEPYKSSKFPSVEIINNNIKMFEKNSEGLRKYIGKRQIEKNVYKVFFSNTSDKGNIAGNAELGNLLEEVGVVSVNFEKLDNDIWIIDNNLILQK